MSEGQDDWKEIAFPDQVDPEKEVRVELGSLDDRAVIIERLMAKLTKKAILKMLTSFDKSYLEELYVAVNVASKQGYVSVDGVQISERVIEEAVAGPKVFGDPVAHLPGEQERRKRYQLERGEIQQDLEVSHDIVEALQKPIEPSIHVPVSFVKELKEELKAIVAKLEVLPVE